VTEPRLAHGYTNQSWIRDGLVFKQYQGLNADERLRSEIRAMTEASDAVPVPKVVEVDENAVLAAFEYMDGRHGQELIEEGYAQQVLHAAGATLHRLNNGSRASSMVITGRRTFFLIPTRCTWWRCSIGSSLIAVIRSKTSPGLSGSSGCTIPAPAGTSARCSMAMGSDRTGPSATPRCRPVAQVTGRPASRGATKQPPRCGYFAPG
jgi:Phosphotransferase enzyme family